MHSTFINHRHRQLPSAPYAVILWWYLLHHIVTCNQELCAFRSTIENGGAKKLHVFANTAVDNAEYFEVGYIPLYFYKYIINNLKFMKIQLWSRSYKSHCCGTAVYRKSYYTMARCINSQFLVMCSITIKKTPKYSTTNFVWV